jgi:hypothetical protein
MKTFKFLNTLALSVNTTAGRIIALFSLYLHTRPYALIRLKPLAGKGW